MNPDTWRLLTLIAALLLARYLWNWWRYPDKACRHCTGTGRITSTDPVTGRKVSRVCARCGGSPWSPRVLSRRKRS